MQNTTKHDAKSMHLLYNKYTLGSYNVQYHEKTMSKEESNMKKKMKSVLAAALACCMLLTGCKGGKEKDSTTVTLDKNSVYQSTEFTLDSKLEGDLQDICVGENIMYLSAYGWKELSAPDATDSDSATATDTDSKEDYDEYAYESTFRLYSAKPDGSGVKMLTEEIQSSEDENPWYLSQMYVGPNDALYMLYSQYKDDKNNFELRVMDADGNIKDTINLDGAIDTEEYICSLIIDKEENIFLVCDETVIVLDKTGKKVNSVKGKGWIMAACLSPDGQVLVTRTGDGEEGQSITRLDAQGNAVGDSIRIKAQSFGSNSMFESKSSDYICYFDDASDLYGVKADGSMTKIINWVSSGMSSQSVYRKCDIGNGEFLILYYDYSEMDSQNSLCKLQKVNPEDVVEKTVITLGGMYISEEISRQVIKYNKSQEQYQIVLKDYTQEEEPDKKFKADILAGDVPDIMVLDGSYADLYASKGLLEDLYPYLEKDPELNKSDFLENPLSLLETNGKLYRISNYFSINAVCARTSQMNGKDQLSLTDVINMDEAAGDLVRGFMHTSNKGVLYNACSYNNDYYIDWEKGTCNFDSEEFIALLEYAKTYPNEEDLDYESMDSMPTMVQNNKVIVTETYGITMEEVEMYDKLYEGDVTFMGYPSNGNAGISAGFWESYAISSKSANKDAAWDFLRTLLTREYYSKNLTYMGTPLRKDCLEDMIKRNSATETYTDDFGQEIEPLNSGYGFDDYEVEIVPLTDKQVEMYRDIVSRVDREYNYNMEIMEIIDEEAAAFFAGQKSASEVAKIIQNRANTYINENK